MTTKNFTVAIDLFETSNVKSFVDSTPESYGCDAAGVCRTDYPHPGTFSTKTLPLHNGGFLSLVNNHSINRFFISIKHMAGTNVTLECHRS